MDLDLGPQIARFRAELRDWITAQAPDGLAELTDWSLPVTVGGYRGQELARAMAHPAYAEWERRLTAARLICPQWPAEVWGVGFPRAPGPPSENEVQPCPAAPGCPT